MNDNYNSIKNLTIEQFINNFMNIIENNNINKKQLIYASILKENIDYKTLYSILDLLDYDDVSIILKYDKDYKIDFLLSLVDKAYEDDLTNQAIFLLKRHNLNYIIPLLPYVDEDKIREEYIKK